MKKKILFSLSLCLLFFSCLAQTELIRDNVKANQKLEIKSGGVFKFGSTTIDGISNTDPRITPESGKVPTEAAVAIALEALQDSLDALEAQIAADLDESQESVLDSLQELETALLGQIAALQDSLDLLESQLNTAISDLETQLQGEISDSENALLDSIQVVKDSLEDLRDYVEALQDKSIYTDSDIINNGIRAEVDAGGDFAFDYSGGNDAIIINDAAGSSQMKSKDSASLIQAKTDEARIVGNDVALQARGSGSVIVDGTSEHGAYLDLFEDVDNGSNFVRLKVPDDISGNFEIDIPDSDGTMALVSDISDLQNTIEDTLEVFRDSIDDFSVRISDLENAAPGGGSDPPRYAMRATKFLDFEDFYSPTSTSATTTVGERSRWQIALNSSATCQHNDTIVGASGIFRMSTGAVSSSANPVLFSRDIFIKANSDFYYETRIRTPDVAASVSANTLFVGLINTQNDAIEFAIGYGGSANWYVISSTNGGGTFQDTGVAYTNGQWVVLSIEYTQSSNTASFKVDGVEIHSEVGGFTTKGLRAEYDFRKGTAASNVNVYVDYCLIIADRQ